MYIVNCENFTKKRFLSVYDYPNQYKSATSS